MDGQANTLAATRRFRWDDAPVDSPNAEVLARLNVSVESYLGGRANRHWLVRVKGERAVLRRYQDSPQGDIDYELAVLTALHDRGWPTPIPLAEPVHVQGRTWAVFRWLPGQPPTTDLTGRGRLLARLHADTQRLAGMGQRAGCVRAEELVADPRLTEALRAYERVAPRAARIMRWHQESAHEQFGRLDLQDRHLVVLHGDFADRNLLYQNGRLTGILDFEATHLNHRVAEFALAWRGRRDALVLAYDEVHPLDDTDWALLAPTLWSWAFIGVADAIEQILSGAVPAHDFDWQVGMLLRRSPLMGAAQAPYPDPD